MPKRVSIQRQRLIISRLRRRPSSFEEIQDFLKFEGELAEDDLTCSLRTFQRDIKDILDLYRIEIKFKRSRNVYEIVEDGNEDHHERLLEAFEVFNALKVSNQLNRQVIVEKRKSMGTEHLYGLLHAIKNQKKVKFRYEKFEEGVSRQRSLKPLAIKEARSRWYLLAQEKQGQAVKSFGLDRISDLEISTEGFEPVDYDPKQAYQNSFGIINGVDLKAEKIVVATTPTQGKYIASLPLHHSQRLLEKTEHQWSFEYYLLPTYDFMMEILSHGDQVEVLEPLDFRQKIRTKLEAALGMYR